MAQTKTALAFIAGTCCAGAIAFAIGAGPEDRLKDAAKDVRDAGAGMINVMGDAPEGMTDEAMAEMQAWLEASTPGAHHEHLAKSVGEWTCTSWFKMDPNADAVQGSGSMTVESVFGGRYVRSHLRIDDLMGQPYEGIAVVAYDNVQEKFTSTWIDSMSTGIYTQDGKMKDGKLVMKGTMVMPDRTEVPHKMTTEWRGEHTVVDTFYEKRGEEWTQHGEIIYTRKGHADAG